MILTEEECMERALELAARGAGLASPNPIVGAVIVRDGEVVGEGYHRFELLRHAEFYALDMAGARAKGATLYCTLEPCCHQGRTPPCTDALIEAGIARVVVAMIDPDSRVSGRGLEQLRRAGVAVEVGLLDRQAHRLNEGYVKFVSTGIPFVHAIEHYGEMAPGAAPPNQGWSRGDAQSARYDSEWIPSPALVESAARYDAILLGSLDWVNEAFASAYFARERHRSSIVAGQIYALKDLEPVIKGGTVLVLDDRTDSGPYQGLERDPEPGASESGKGWEVRHVPFARPSDFRGLLWVLAELHVTSLAVLPGVTDISSIYDQVDKVTVVRVPQPRGTTGRIVLPAGREITLRDIEETAAEGFVETTGYPVRK